MGGGKRLFMRSAVLGTVVCGLMGAAIQMGHARGNEDVFLGDARHLILVASMGWGEMGLNGAAHAPGKPVPRLRIGEKKYTKGIGHHADGELLVELDEGYSRFQCEVGVQWQGGGTPASVIFKVYTDGELRFDSGVMRETDPARAVDVDLLGVRVMRLVVDQAGDGIGYDSANWANARLVPAPAAFVRKRYRMDVARFAQPVTCDPARTDGARAGRTEEYLAEDVFLEAPFKGGEAPLYKDGRRCVGLVWVERRQLASVAIDLEGEAEVSLEAWVGPTLFQGKWVPVAGAAGSESGIWSMDIDRAANPELRSGTRKLRWILTGGQGPVTLRSMRAFSRLETGSAALRIDVFGQKPSSRSIVRLYNAEIDGPAGAQTELRFGQKGTLQLSVRHLVSGYWKGERATLRFTGLVPECAVAIDDVIANGCVFVPDPSNGRRGIYVALSDGQSLEEYRESIRSRKTILERVRELPDQTLERALANTRNPVQDNGPTLLSLACDTRKFISHQDGSLQFRNEDQPPEHGVWQPLAYPCRMTVSLAGGGKADFGRHLCDGWYPAPVVTADGQDGGWTQRTYVAPVAGRQQANGKAFERSVCVSEIALGGKSSAGTEVRVRFAAEDEQAAPVRLVKVDGNVGVYIGSRLAAGVFPQDGTHLLSENETSTVAILAKAGRSDSLRCTVLLPAYPSTLEELADVALKDLYGAFRRHWDSVMGPAVRIDLPDALLTNVIRASQVHCLIAARNEADGERVSPWIASMSYGPLESEANSIVRGMSLLGHREFAERSLDYFIHRYSPEGFLTTGYTMMGTGWHLWTLGRHVSLCGDAAWMGSRAEDVARACDWVIRQTDKTRTPEGWDQVAYDGLMPPGVMADWGNYAYYFYLNGYYCAGLTLAALALSEAGHPAAQRVRNAAERMRKDILSAYSRAIAVTPVVPLKDGTWAPAYPSQVHTPGRSEDFFPGEDANRSWAYDVELGAHHLMAQGVLPVDDKAAEGMLEHMEDVQFLASGWFDYSAERNEAEWFDLGGFAKVQPYYGRYPEIYAMRRDVKPFVRSYFNMLASLLNTQNLSLWEHFRNAGAWNKTHETGYFLQQTRMMLVNEYGDELWLAPLVTDRWLLDGCRIAVREAPSRFGVVSYTIESHVNSGRIAASVELSTRSPASAIVLNLRHPRGKRISGVRVNGEEWRDYQAAKGIVRLQPSAGRQSVEVLY